MDSHAHNDLASLAAKIKQWGRELGFQQVGIAGIELFEDAEYLARWLAARHHGEMDYMERHGMRRAQPDAIQPGALRVISARMDYLSAAARPAQQVLADPDSAYVSRYALGRDYHKVLRKRLAELGAKITREACEHGHRAFVDSAPLLEKALARNAGLGWIGKHTNLINRHAGSWFFLGELLTDLPLPIDAPASNHCGTCTACMEVCPTQAIVGPYELDARRCISYLTIELRGPIPLEFRRAIGNRIYGCDDCQLFCPWNKFAHFSEEPDFTPRHRLDEARLLELFAWTEEEFLARTEGSAIRRIGYQSWLRNIAVALGNAPYSSAAIQALQARREQCSAMVKEHIEWALGEQNRKQQVACDKAPAGNG